MSEGQEQQLAQELALRLARSVVASAHAEEEERQLREDGGLEAEEEQGRENLGSNDYEEYLNAVWRLATKFSLETRGRMRTCEAEAEVPSEKEQPAKAKVKGRQGTRRIRSRQPAARKI